MFVYVVKDLRCCMFVCVSLLCKLAQHVATCSSNEACIYVFVFWWDQTVNIMLNMRSDWIAKLNRYSKIKGGCGYVKHVDEFFLINGLIWNSSCIVSFQNVHVKCNRNWWQKLVSISWIFYIIVSVTVEQIFY